MATARCVGYAAVLISVDSARDGLRRLLVPPLMAKQLSAATQITAMGRTMVTRIAATKAFVNTSCATRSMRSITCWGSPCEA